MAEPVKIFAINSDNVVKGLSKQKTNPVGGIFKRASGFNPFIKYGQLTGGTGAAAGSAQSAVISGTFLPYTTGGVTYMYGYAGNYMYLINTSTNAVSDVTANIDNTGTTRANMIRYSGKLIYTKNTSVRSNAFPVASGSDVEILTGLGSVAHPMTIGGDKFLYIGNGQYLARITNTAGTSGNSTNVLALESGMSIRDLTSDGRYVIILADNSEQGLDSEKCDIQIIFWDMVSGTYAQLYELSDSVSIGIEHLNGTTYIFTSDRAYFCSIGSIPRMLFDFGTNSSVLSPENYKCISTINNSIVWASDDTIDSTSVSRVFAFGNPIGGDPILYEIGFYSGSGIVGGSIGVFGSGIYLGNDDNKYTRILHKSSSSEATIQTTPIPLNDSYELNSIFLYLDEPIATLDSITIKISSPSADGDILASTTIDNDSYSGKKSFTILPKKNLIFNTIEEIEIVSDDIDIYAIEIYGTKQDKKSLDAEIV